MEIGPLSRLSMGAAVSAHGAAQYLEQTLELVFAIGGLNRHEFRQQGRVLTLRLGLGKRPAMVDLVDLETGEVLDELPPEQVLRMMFELEKESDEEKL
jgi:hypothetical protein